MKLNEGMQEGQESEQGRSKALIAAVALSVSALTSGCAVDYIRTRPYYLDRGGVYYPDRSYHHHREEPRVIIIQKKTPPPPPPRKVIIIDNSRGGHNGHHHNNHRRDR